jgi:hypothetical protein
MFPEWLLPPPLSDAWATAYLQVLFQGFLFALGVPTAIYSLIIDNDIKRVGQTRVRAGVYFLATAFLYLGVMIFVWFHPRSPAAPRAATPDERAAASTTQGATETANGASTEVAVPRNFVSILAPVSVTFLPFVVLSTGLWLNRQFKRRKVVERLANVLADTFDNDGYLDDTALDDLTYLGEHGLPGDEKKLVLDVIDQLAGRVQANLAQYKGIELEKLIRNVERMVDNKEKPGNEENYQQAAAFLANVWARLRPSLPRKLPTDATSTLETLKHLALLTAKKMSDQTALIYLEESAACDSDIVFQIGLEALEERRYFIATAALVKLEGLASDVSEGKPVYSRDGKPLEWIETPTEIVSNLLGLIAHFARAGESTRRRAETSLAVSFEYFTPSLYDALDEAFEYHYNSGRYATSDSIAELKTKTARDFDQEIASPPAA